MLTHVHFDHIYGLNRLVEMNPDVRIYTNEGGREMLLDAKKNLSRYHDSPFVIQYPDRIVTVNDGDEIEAVEDMPAKAIFTPGYARAVFPGLWGTLSLPEAVIYPESRL